MATFSLQTRYTIYADTPITLPEGKTPTDISSISLRYGKITVSFKDGSVTEDIDEQDLDFDTIDYKFPDQTRLYSREGETEDLVYEE